MKRRDILKLDDLTLDQKVKIQGTQFDRKRKLKDKDWKKIKRLLSRGFTYEQVASKFNCSIQTLRYNLEEDYREMKLLSMSGKHTGIDVHTFEDRVLYKRTLIKKRKIKAKTIM